MGVPPEVDFSGWKQRNHYQKASKLQKRKTLEKTKIKQTWNKLQPKKLEKTKNKSSKKNTI